MRVNSSRAGRVLALMMITAAWLPLTSHAYDLIAPVSLWPVGDVNWKENLVGNGTNIPIPSVGSPLQDGSTSWGQALQKAIDDLNAVIPDEVLTLSITQDSGIAAGSQDDVNNVEFAATVYGNAWGGSTVGISLSLWTGNRKTENDVLFNATKTWNSYEGPQQGGITDFRRIALHEFGHSLGLDHPDDAGQVVSAIMNSVSSDIDELQQDDIDGILSIYGAIMPIQITTHPQSYTTPVGGSWPFSVVATGSELITYDWEQSTNSGATWSDIGFDSSTTMGSFSGLGMGQNGMQIRVNVTNPAGTVTSNVATLTVTASAQAPAITAHPANDSVIVGEDATFTVAASGSETPTIQWQLSSNGGATWSNVSNGFTLPSGPTYSGATTTTLQITASIAGINGRMYRAVATNSAGSATSDAATLTVTGVAVAPTIATHPSSATVFEGDPASFTVVASGTAPLSYQWKKGGVDIGGETSATYSIVSAMETHEGSYTVVVSNSEGSVTSNAATLTVDPPVFAPTITSHPSSASVTVGDPASFTVVATGTAPLSYQWRKGGVNISGATSATYNIAATVDGDAGSYTCVVTNVAGSATSNAATLTVNTPPAITSHPAAETAVIGAQVTFSVTATGTAPLTYQWRRNGVDIAGATNSSYTVSSVEGSHGGAYTVVVTNAAGSVTSDGAVLTIDSTPRLINVSCRAFAGSGATTLIMGFYINGTGMKELIIRGVGPKLLDYQVPTVVADPSITVYKGDDPIASNNDWNSALAPDFLRVGAFELNTGSKDAAIKVTLEPGLYTVHLVNNGPIGEGVIEVYDFSRDLGSRLTNVSCRLNMNPNQLVILGTALIAGQTGGLVRNVGPGIAPYLPDPNSVLADPHLRVFSGPNEVAVNDDWELATRAYFVPTGAFDLPDGSKDAAVRVMLTPGENTVHATGKGGGGIAIIEIYESP